MNNAFLGRSVPMQRSEVSTRNAATVVTVYLCAIGGAEAALLTWSVTAGTILHALILLVLLGHFTVRSPRIPIGAIGAPDFAFERALPVLALLPLLRILSLTIPIRHVPEVYWYAMIGVPLLAAMGLTVRVLELSPRALFGSGMRLSQLAIALTGVPLAMGAYEIVKPHGLAIRGDWKSICAGFVILFLFSGVTEELLYRGLLQRSCVDVLGAWGVHAAALISAVMYIGTQSAGYVVFMAGAGLMYGFLVRRTGSIWGVAASHGILNAGALIVLPLLLR